MFISESNRGPALAGASLLVLSIFGTPAFAQQADDPANARSTDTSSADAEAQPADSDEVVVTGSRIARRSAEGPAPVTTISGDAIDQNGFRSVFDALTSLSENTGSVQGEDFGSTFTPAANFVNLRGLGPNHSLVLLNGRRLADYPIAYDGSVNAVNLANIPNAFVDSIEILSGSAGAVYGSDAIAGVVNLKLKEKVDGLEFNLRVGNARQGGGRNIRGQFIGGKSIGRLDLVLGGEISSRDPIWWDQRKIANSYSRYSTDDLPQVPPAVFAIRNPSNRVYYTPAAGTCEGLAGYQADSVRLVAAATGGSYCGSDKYYNFRTIQTEKDAQNFYGRATFHLDDSTDLYASALYNQTEIRNVVRTLTWSSTFFNRATDRLETWSRALTPEEVGGRFGTASTYEEKAWTVTAGIRGRIGADWKYDLAYNRSEYRSDQGRVRLLAGITSFFLGEQQGTQNGFAAYDAPNSRLYTPLGAGEFGSLSQLSMTRNKTKLQDLALSLGGPLLELPAGPLQFSGTVEVGDSSFSNIADPDINRGVYYGTSSALSSGGKRKRQAIAGELRLPAFSWLTLTGAGRYDRYEYGGGDIGAFTYGGGIEARPTRSLLLRGSISTSFRAPDMSYLFQQETRGYYPGPTDYYQCRLDGAPYSSCNNQYNMNFVQSGNRDLKPERGRSITAGIVWSPNRHFDISVDYYRIKLRDLVTSLSYDQLLLQEADCRIGRSVSGTPVDPSSSICRDYVERIERNPADAAVNPNQVTLIHNNPINASNEWTDGIDVSANLRWKVSNVGKFTLSGKYTRVLSHKYRQFAGDPSIDYLNDIAHQTDWRDRANLSLTYSTGPLTLNLYGQRFGKIPKNDYSGTRAPYTTFNGSATLDVTRDVTLGLFVNNLADKYPVDKSGGWPYYSIGFYDIYGRQIWLQASHKFGGR